MTAGYVLTTDLAGAREILTGLARGARRPAIAPLPEHVERAVNEACSRKLVSGGELVDLALAQMFAPKAVV